MFRYGVFVALTLYAVLLTACATVPEPELRGYIGAFDTAREAGGELYGQLDQAVDRAARLAAGAEVAGCGPAKPAPRCFDPAEVLPRASEPREPSIKARLVTFDAVALYNDTLIALATGSTGAALERRLGKLSGALNQAVAVGAIAVPGAGALAPILSKPVVEGFTTLAVKIETARANAEARAALLSNEMLIDEAISALIADTAAVYDLYLASQGSVASSAPGAPTSDEAAAEFAKITEFHTALKAYVVLLGKTRESDDALHTALTAIDDPASHFDAAIDQAVEIGAAAITFRDAIEALNQ